MEGNINPNTLNKEMIEFLYNHNVELIIEFDGTRMKLFVQKRKEEEE